MNPKIVKMIKKFKNIKNLKKSLFARFFLFFFNFLFTEKKLHYHSFAIWGDFSLTRALQSNLFQSMTQEEEQKQDKIPPF